MGAGVKVGVGGCDVGGWVREREGGFLGLLCGEELSFFLIFFSSSIFLLLKHSCFYHTSVKTVTV